MALPFASAYQPINLLNDAIQAQQARQNQGYLQASALNDASVADSLNRIVQQKALEQQSRDRQAHYGLQQQQLANDLAYRNAALKEAEARSIEQARQFDAQFGLNKKIAEAQLNNPFFGAGKDFAAYGLQAGQDAASHNAAATAIASQATGALAAARQAYKAEVAQINDPNWYQWAIRKLPITATKDDLLNAAKAKFDASYSKILNDLGPHRDKVSFAGAPEENGVFQPVLLTPPAMPGMQPKPTSEMPKVESEGANPFGRFSTGGGGAPEIRPDAAMVPASTAPPSALISNFVRPNPLAITAQPFVGFGQGNVRTNAPPAVVAAPAITIQPIPAAQAAEGVHFRTNPDGSVIVLRPIVGLNGKILTPGNILRP